MLIAPCVNEVRPLFLNKFRWPEIRVKPPKIKLLITSVANWVSVLIVLPVEGKQRVLSIMVLEI